MDDKRLRQWVKGAIQGYVTLGELDEELQYMGIEPWMIDCTLKTFHELRKDRERNEQDIDDWGYGDLPDNSEEYDDNNIIHVNFGSAN